MQRFFSHFKFLFKLNEHYYRVLKSNPAPQNFRLLHAAAKGIIINAFWAMRASSRTSSVFTAELILFAMQTVQTGL